VDPQPPQLPRNADPVIGVAAPSKSPEAREDAEEQRSKEVAASEPENPGRAIPREVDG